jgi:hypothetical protein
MYDLVFSEIPGCIVPCRQLEMVDKHYSIEFVVSIRNSEFLDHLSDYVLKNTLYRGVT